MGSELRQRPAAMRPDEPAVPTSAKKGGCPVQIKSGTYYWVRKAVVILGPAYILACMFEAMEPPEPLIRHAWDDIILALGKGPRVSSAAELKARGVGRRPELSILGEVFDVTKGSKHYGKGGAYEGFTGKDASRAFVTGDFSEAGLTDDVSGLTPSQCLGVKDWHKFYRNDEKYKARGLLAGRFYDKKGRPKKALRDFEKCAEEGRKEKEQEAQKKELYPSCNSRWAAAEGGRVWCEDPKKVPRKFAPETVHGSGIRSGGGSQDAVKPGRSDKKSGEAADAKANGETNTDAAKAKGRCSCFAPDFAESNQDRLLSYRGCAPGANSCVTKPPDPSKKRR